jgi:hypothetical protein
MHGMRYRNDLSKRRLAEMVSMTSRRKPAPKGWHCIRGLRTSVQKRRLPGRVDLTIELGGVSQRLDQSFVHAIDVSHSLSPAAPKHRVRVYPEILLPVIRAQAQPLKQVRHALTFVGQ